MDLPPALRYMLDTEPLKRRERKKMTDPNEEQRRAKVLAELRRDVALRQRGYRERALRLFPHVCARCGRELIGKRLRELTVHHKDHNHDNNPPDGSNWELVCLYCHDYEHEKLLSTNRHEAGSDDAPPPATFNPFENLESLLKKRPEA